MASRRSRVRTPPAPPSSLRRVKPDMYFVYILRSESTGRYYVGHTKNINERLPYHNANYSKALKNRGPWTVVYSEAHDSRSEAMKRELRIKRQKNRQFIDQLVSASR
jgi:putative endonuclease